MYKRILVPLSETGASESEWILKHAQRMAAGFDAEIVLLYVQEPPIMLGWDEVIDRKAYCQRRVSQREAIEAYLAEQQARLQTKGLKTSYRIISGETPESTLTASGEEEESLLVIAAHPQDDQSRLMRSSMAARMLRKGHVPMLLLPGV